MESETKSFTAKEVAQIVAESIRDEADCLAAAYVEGIQSQSLRLDDIAEMLRNISSSIVNHLK